MYILQISESLFDTYTHYPTRLGYLPIAIGYYESGLRSCLVSSRLELIVAGLELLNTERH